MHPHLIKKKTAKNHPLLTLIVHAGPGKLLVDIMAADALAPGVARSSAAMILTMYNGDILIFL